ncbi:OprO/OprP family phosphate-selective porin [Kordiimonas pumila]|uniref:OprO/OprP family phosphate-selective porin n=1 Tax=Kordiimonas pumila TaxID=2161677 RepID=A0ABV7D7Q1_9PROT|nr:porin [Kordiimonas pumila]
MRYRTAIAMPLAMAISASAMADSETDLELRKIVMQQAAELAELKARLAQLEEKSSVKAVAVSGEARTVASASSAAPATPASATESKETGFTIKPRGRIEYDTVFYDQNDGGRSYNDGSSFRRARLGVQGTLPGNFEYQIEADFAGGDSVKLDDTYLRYKFSPNTAVTFGFHKVYHSLESATSDLDVTFMERHMVSNIFEVGAGGKMGVSVLQSGSNWSGQFGVFAGSANSGDANKDGWGFNGRVTWAPILEEGKLLHVGLDAYYRNEDDDVLSMGDRPEIRNDSFKPFDSGTLIAESYRYGNAEIAGVLGPVSAQFEYSVLETSSSTGDQSFDGYSGQVSYFLTGESRPYSAGKGYFGKLKPFNPVGEGGMGAFELAARYSRIDLSDAGQGTYGDNLTLGINWYPTDAVRFMLNAVDFSAKGALTESGRAYGMRAQVRW